MMFPEGRKAGEIILALSKGKLTFTNLARTVGGSQTTIENRIRELEEIGLIKEEKQNKFPCTRTIYLTPNGMLAAIYIERLLKLMRKHKEAST